MVTPRSKRIEACANATRSRIMPFLSASIYKQKSGGMRAPGNRDPSNA
jgi:hypothetical protein